MAYVHPSERPGLQAERTDLSWARTSLSFAVNGLLLLIRYQLPGHVWLHFGAAGLAGLLLAFTLFMSRRRRRVLAQKPLPEPLADSNALMLLACGTSLLGVIFVTLLLLA